VGSLADSMGRKKFCLLYCALYIVSCATKHFNSYWILMLGRLTGGTATSLLFSVFESWLVCAHNENRYPENLLGEIFASQMFANSLTAIFSGVLAEFAASWFSFYEMGNNIWIGGFTTPFDVASFVLIMGGFILSATWTENYGEKQTNQFSGASLKSAMEIIQQNRSVLLVGLIQSLFEASMFSFVFEWTPALSGSAKTPYGTIFATFMVACMAGSQIFSRFLSSGSPRTSLLVVLVASALALAIVPLDFALSTNLKYFGFLVFESLVGMYFPLMSTLKSQIVPEDHRSTIYNIFRVPLNALVVSLLLADFSVLITFSLCVGLLGLAALLTTRVEDRK